MTPLERAIAALNNTARVQDVSGDQMGVLGASPLYVVTNPEEVARAVIAAIRDPSSVMIAAGHPAAEDSGSTGCWFAMIDAMLEEG